MNKNIIKQAQELQAKLAKAQEQLGEMTTEVSSGGGAITVVIDGHQNVRSITISPEVIDPEDVEMLEDMVLAAMNEAITKSQELAANHLNSLTGGMKLPGIM
ncbi:MAG: YbaB/EbfC family nucleoid-associated protein, partial [Dehalococcoidia bacterium]|jgi:DNA-binding YbaB/EbfC family protein